MDFTKYTGLDVKMEATDGAFADDKRSAQDGHIEGVYGIGNATANGLPAVVVKVALADGSVVYASTTMALFEMAARAIAAYWEGKAERERIANGVGL